MKESSIKINNNRLNRKGKLSSLKYYSENGYFINIKNHLDKEISLDELIEQYFGNVHDYFEDLEDNNSNSSSTTTEA